MPGLNYIHLLRKALKKDGLDFIPVISINLSGLESNSGFKITLPMIRRALAALSYGDLLMLLKNQTKPYEATPGESDALVDTWIQKLTSLFEEGKAFSQQGGAGVLRADRPLLRRSEAPGRGENQSGRGGRDLRQILPWPTTAWSSSSLSRAVR